MAYYEDGDYMARSEQGGYVGFNIDYLDEIARYANWSYDYVDYAGFEDAYAALEAGEVDLLPSVYRTEERARSILFSESALCEIYTTLNVRTDDTRYAYEDFSAFQGMTVGIIKGGIDGLAFEHYCAANSLSVDVVPFVETQDLLDALADGEVDGIAITYLGKNSQFRTVAQFAPQPLYCAIAPTEPDIATELDNAISQLKLRDPDFSSSLYDQYFSLNTNQDPVFSNDEYAYLAGAPTLRVVYDSFRMPFSYTDPETNEFAGVAAHLFKDIARVTGLRFEFVPVDSHADGVAMVSTGQADIIYGVDRDVEKETLGAIRTTGPYLSNPMAEIARGNPQGSRIALPTGFSLAAEVEAAHPHAEARYYNTPKQCLDAVLDGRADIAYADIYMANYLLAESQYQPLSILSLTDYTNDMRIGVSRSADPRLAPILDRCIQYTSSSKLSTWVSQSALAVHPTSPLDFLRQYPLQIIAGLFILFAAIVAAILYIARTKVRTNRHIQKLSYSDPLTGGWNLARFGIEARRILADEGEQDHAIVYLDISRFKAFNAEFGFAEGDRLLIGLDGLLGDLARGRTECHARIEGDEFVALIAWKGREEALARFRELDSLFNALPALTSREHRMLLLAGIRVVEPGAVRDEALSELIDDARYARESIGEAVRSTAACYTDDMKVRDIEQRMLLLDAERGLGRGEFVAYYQPKVSLATNEIKGFEALARWESPERGLVPPDSFIPQMERSGLVIELDLHLFRLACERLRQRIDAGRHVVPIACNFSRRHLLGDAFPATLKRIVEETGAPIELLELELTESMVMEDFERAHAICSELKELGFLITIDDFGSGYSSLGTLRDLPIDVLKLDRSFLVGSESSARSRTILEGVVRMADELGVQVVAEGVETRAQADQLRALDERIIAQGFRYSRPVPLQESDRQLDARAIDPKG